PFRGEPVGGLHSRRRDAVAEVDRMPPEPDAISDVLEFLLRSLLRSNRGHWAHPADSSKYSLNRDRGSPANLNLASGRTSCNQLTRVQGRPLRGRYFERTLDLCLNYLFYLDFIKAPKVQAEGHGTL